MNTPLLSELLARAYVVDSSIQDTDFERIIELDCMLRGTDAWESVEHYRSFATSDNVVFFDSDTSGRDNGLFGGINGISYSSQSRTQDIEVGVDFFIELLEDFILMNVEGRLDGLYASKKSTTFFANEFALATEERYHAAILAGYGCDISIEEVFCSPEGIQGGYPYFIYADSKLDGAGEIFLGTDTGKSYVKIGGVAMMDLIMSCLPEPVQEDVEWIQWDGGECPVAPDAMVMVEMRCEAKEERQADQLRWTHIKSDAVPGMGDIMAYYVTKPSELEKPRMMMVAAKSDPVQRKASPRFRKPRKPVPKQKQTIVRVLYTSQQTYTVKHVSNVVVEAKEAINIAHSREITEGIRDQVFTVIDPELVMALIIIEPESTTTLFRNIDGSWEAADKTGLVAEGATRITKNIK